MEGEEDEMRGVVEAEEHVRELGIGLDDEHVEGKEEEEDDDGMRVELEEDEDERMVASEDKEEWDWKYSDSVWEVLTS